MRRRRRSQKRRAPLGAYLRARVVAILRYTLRSDEPKKLNSDNQLDSVTENPLLQTPTLLFVSVF